MKRLFFIGCWTLILTLLIPDRAKGDTFVDSLRREIKVLPDSSKLIRLNELLMPIRITKYIKYMRICY